MRPLALGGAVAFALCTAAGPAHANAGARLAALLDGVSTFRATFTQVVLNRRGEALQTTTGTLHWQRPHRLRWAVDEPYPQLVLADGQALWVFDPDLEQVTVRPLAETIAGTPASFLAGTAEHLTRQFDVSADAAEPDGTARFVLTPRDDASVFREITLAIAPTGTLTFLEIADHLDQRTRTTFTAAAKNPPLDDALFTFDIPPGVDVIGEVPTASVSPP